MSSWKLTKKLKETHFLRGHMPSSSSNSSNSPSTTGSSTHYGNASNGAAVAGSNTTPSVDTASSVTNRSGPEGSWYEDALGSSATLTSSVSPTPSSSAVASGSSPSSHPHHQQHQQSIPASKEYAPTPTNGKAHSDQEARHAASLDTLVAGSRSNTITASSRGTITAQSASHAAHSSSARTASGALQNGSGRAAGSNTSRGTSSVARNAAGLLRVKIYELRHLLVQEYRSVLPAWAFEKSSTKPPPVYIVLEYDKTQILLHSIGGTVEDPVWDKTTAFDVVSGNVPLTLSLYLRTRTPHDSDPKKTSSESERRSSHSEDTGGASHPGLAPGSHHHTSDTASDSNSEFQPSSVTSNTTTASIASNTTSTNSVISNAKKSGSGGGSAGGNDNGKGNAANAVKEAEELRIKDILLATTKIEPTDFNKQEQLSMASGVLSVKCELHNTRNQSLSIEDFTLMKVVGKGSFGKVMQVRKNDTRQVYALKTIRKAHIVSKSEVGHTLAERTVLAKINNPFIVPLKFSFQSPEKLYLVLAFVNGGELFHHLQREGRFDLNRARFYTAELLCALECLHEYNVIYRDLKPENILLDYTGHIALCDFGLCKLNMGSKDQTSTFCGTPEYLAPELLLGQGYTKAVDWWTLGVLFYEMLTGLPPFYDQNTNTMYHKIVKDPLTFPADMDREAKSLISLLLDRDPTRRLGAHGAAEIKAHPFFHQIDWKYLLNKKYAAPFLPSVASAVDTSNFDSEFTSEVPMDSVVDKQFYLSESVQQQFGGWSYSTESRLASSGKW